MSQLKLITKIMSPIAANWRIKIASTQIFVDWIVKTFCLSLLLLVSACQQQSKPEKKLNQNNANITKVENRLILNNAILEQSNDRGQILWKIKADRTIYSPDRQVARLENIVANIFQDGEMVLRISGKTGEINQDGQEMLLKDQIIATDLRTQAVIRASEAWWYPEKDLLIVRRNLTGNHPKLNLWANEARYFPSQQRLELRGQIVAIMSDPPLQMKADYLYWEMAQQKAIAEPPPDPFSEYRPPEISRYKNNTITDQVSADRIIVDLNTNTARLQENVQLKSLDPPLQIATNSVIWKYQQGLIIADRPVEIVDTQAQITITGNQGQMDLEREIAHLQGGVRAINSRQPAKLYSNELIWKIPNQTVEATGNVIYQQADPEFNVAGAKAVGQLANNQVIVIGDKDNKVLTTIFP